MTVERSERGVLTTKADFDYRDQYESSFEGRIIGSQWTIENNEILSYNVNFQASSLPDNYTRAIRYLTFVGTTTNNDKLEFGVISRKYNSNVGLTETDYYPANTKVAVFASAFSNQTNQANVPAFTIYVRRVDGGILTPSSMENSTLIWSTINTHIYPITTALPQEWLTGTAGTYTTDFSTMTTVVPAVCDIDDNEFNAFIDIPNKIVAGINLCILGIGSLLNLKYVTFMICFVLIVGLVAWLIH